MEYENQFSRDYLKTNRGWLKLILLSMITAGIYAIVFYTKLAKDLNLIASRYDGRKTMHYCLVAFVIAPVTAGIGGIVWLHRLCARMGNELDRRGLAYNFGAGHFWGWCVLGSLLCGIGPLVFLHKLCCSMNLLCGDYNARG